MELPLTKLPFLLVNSYFNLCRLPWAPPFLSSLLSFWMPTSPVETSPSIYTVVIFVYIFSVERRPYINIWNVELEMPWGRDWATCSLTCCYPPTQNLSFLPLLGLHTPYQKKYSFSQSWKHFGLLLLPLWVINPLYSWLCIWFFTYRRYGKVKVTQSCLILCNPKDYIVHGILKVRILSG